MSIFCALLLFMLPCLRSNTVMSNTPPCEMVLWAISQSFLHVPSLIPTFTFPLMKYISSYLHHFLINNKELESWRPASSLQTYLLSFYHRSLLPSFCTSLTIGLSGFFFSCLSSSVSNWVTCDINVFFSHFYLLYQERVPVLRFLRCATIHATLPAAGRRAVQEPKILLSAL